MSFSFRKGSRDFYELYVVGVVGFCWLSGVRYGGVGRLVRCLGIEWRRVYWGFCFVFVFLEASIRFLGSFVS